MKINLMIMTDNVLCPGVGILWEGPYKRVAAVPQVANQMQLYTTPAQPGASVKLIKALFYISSGFFHLDI